MGGVVGSPLDETHQQRIKESLETILKTFTKVYTKAYLIALLEKIKEEVTEEPEEWQLQTRPESERPTEPLKEGYLTKQGVLRKSWKRRYFVVYPNHKIDYFESQEAYQQEKKPKGTIVCGGFSIHKDPVKTRLDDLASIAGKLGAAVTDLPQPDKLPEHCFEVHHRRRRCFFIAAENEEEKLEWVKVFRQCTWKCRSFRTDDEVANIAFIEGIRYTRGALGYYGWFSLAGTEPQILTDVIVDEVDYQVMRDVYHNLKGPWAIRWMVRGQVIKALDGSIENAVRPALAGMKSTITQVRERAEPIMREKVGAIYEAKDIVQDKIRDACLDRIRPVLAEKVAPHLTDVLKVLFSPMIDAFAETKAIFEDLVDDVTKKVVDSNGLGPSMSVHFRPMDRTPRSTWSMRKPYNKVDSGMDTPLWALRQFFEDIEPRNLISEAHTKLSMVLDNAVYTFEKELIEAAGPDFSTLDAAAAREIIQECKFSVREKFTQDAHKAAVDYFKSIMVSIAMPPLLKALNPVCSPILEPIGDVIPEPFKDFIDVEEMFEETVEKVVQGAVDALVDPACDGFAKGSNGTNGTNGH